jgi:hypothetical protein
MKLTGENRSSRRKTCPSATLSATYPTWTDPGTIGVEDSLLPNPSVKLSLGSCAKCVSNRQGSAVL